MRGICAGWVSLSLICVVANLQAEEPTWRPSLGRPVALAGQTSEASETSEVRAGPGPMVTLGRPVPLSADVQPVSYQTVDNPSSSRIARGQMPESGPLLAVPGPTGPGVPGSAAEQYNCAIANDNPPAGHPFLDGLRRMWDSIPGIGGGAFDSDGRHHLFESDHAFNDFISPVSNPFYFEDPRSLTEVRPVFLYQGTPEHNYIFHGGDIEYFGVEGRLAITDWFSIVMPKLGWTWIEPHVATADFQPHGGFSEINIGPKFTFFRCEGTGTIVAAGLNFEIPAGSSRVLQDTGSLTLEPYITAGQRFGHTKYGTFHALGTFGYNASVDNQRSDNLFLSMHLDFDYGDLHKIYPLLEFNWFHYTSSGKAHDLNFEGRDLFNFGATQVAGNDDASVAVGVRYQQNEHLSFGFAAEWPITGRKDLMDYRLLFDVIFRY
jgi:hypothetical protein